MADRSIAVHIKAVVTDFQRAMGQAEGSLKGFNQTAKRTAEDYSSAMTTVGIAAAGAGLAIAGGLAAGVKAAVDWESSFAGVVKTVDATTEELAVLERGLRDLALEIPVSQAELAGIAEAAGQLGIETGNILEFTETMAALGVATNLTSEEAATMFARFANITQLPQDQIENLGSAVVDLGNNLATTEAEIIEMGLRIAGAGAQIGLTEAEILGFAGALSSVGIEAQAGGSAISRVFIEVDKAVRAGGDSLAGFAETAGMSAEEFRQAYEEDAAGAIVTFIEGLGRISASGGDVFSILEDLELQDLRVRDALLRAAGAGDLFRESIDRSSTAFEANTALTEEAARRYETVASQFEIFKNTLVELGIGIGEVLLPVLTPLLDGATNLVRWFSDLPEPVKITAIALAGVSAALLAISGTALILAPRIMSLVSAYNLLAGAAGRAAAGMGAANAAAGAGAAGSAARGVGMLGAGGAAGMATKALPVIGAGFAVFEAGQAGKQLADDIGRQNQDLATKLAQTMLLAEQGDEAAKKGLQNVRNIIDNANAFDRNVNFMSEAFVANRAWENAIDMLERGEVAIEGIGDAAAEAAPKHAMFGGEMSQIPKYNKWLGDQAFAFENAAKAQEHWQEAQRGTAQLLLEASDVTFATISAVERYMNAEENLQKVQEDSEATDRELAAAKVDLAEAALEAQAAIDRFSGNNAIRGASAIAEALGISTDEAYELLEALGLLDGRTVTTYVDTIFRSQGNQGPTGRNTQIGGRAAGGPVTQGSMYRVGEGNLPELLKTPSGLFMVPGESGQMFSNRDTKALIAALQNMSGGGVSITIPSSGNPEQDAALAITMAGLTRRVETTRR